MFSPTAIVIADPQLRAEGSHYLAQDLLLACDCQARNIPVSILCKKDVNVPISGLEVRPIFSLDIFDEIHADPFENYNLINRVMFDDLSSIPVESLANDQLFYFPNLLHSQIEGIADWVMSLPRDRRPRISITLRWANSRMFYNVNRQLTESIEILYRQAVQRLISVHPESYFFVDTKGLAKFFSAVSGAVMRILPVPQANAPSLSGEYLSSPRTEITILFLGTSAPQRGFQFLPSIVSAALNEHLTIKFLIQVPSETVRYHETIGNVITALKTIPGDRVRLLPGPLSVDQYWQVLSEADIALLPYEPTFYSLGSSGVLTEAASLGKVLVVTKGTTLEQFAIDFSLGHVTADSWTAVAFSEALTVAIQNFEALSQLSKRNASAFAHYHCARSFWSHMFEALS
jgi:glycosyltransferase involved in cell wall biosynthesis